MKKIKILGFIIFAFISFILFLFFSPKKNIIEIPMNKWNKLYKNYVFNSMENSIEFKDFFSNEEINFKDENLKRVIELDKNYELYQLKDEIVLKTLDSTKKIKGQQIKKIGEYYIFELNNSYGLFDKNLNILIPPSFEELYGNDKSNILLAKNNGKYGYIDNFGKVIIPFMYEMGALIDKELAIVQKDKKIGIVNLKNEIILDFLYDAIYYYNNNCFLALKENKYYLIKNNISEEIDINWAGIQKDNIIFYEKEGKFGIFDLNGKFLTKNIYNQLSQNYNKLIIAMLDNKYGLIDKNGEVKTEFIYDYIIPVGQNFFLAGKDDSQNSFLLDSKGKMFIEDNYDEYFEINSQNIIGIKNGKPFIIKPDKKIIKNIDQIIDFNDQFVLYITNNKKFLLKL